MAWVLVLNYWILIAPFAANTKKVTRWFLVFCVGDRLLYWKFDYSRGDESVYPFLPDSKKRRCEKYHWPLEVIERCKKQQTGIYPIEHKWFTLETCRKLITKNQNTSHCVYIKLSHWVLHNTYFKLKFASIMLTTQLHYGLKWCFKLLAFLYHKMSCHFGWCALVM